MPDMSQKISYFLPGAFLSCLFPTSCVSFFFGILQLLSIPFFYGSRRGEAWRSCAAVATQSAWLRKILRCASYSLYYTLQKFVGPYDLCL